MHPPLTRIGRRFGLLAAMLLALAPLAEPVPAQDADADVLTAQAVLAYEEKRYDAALALLREALVFAPAHIEALYYSGLVHLARKEYAAAVPPLESALSRAPDDLSIAFQLGVAYFSLERYDQAEPLLLKIFTERPQTDNLGYYVGFLRYRHKDYRGAVDAFQASASSDPDIQQLTRFYAGLALGILGLPERAAAELDEASRMRTVSPITGPADRLRDTLLAAVKRESRWHGELRLGGYSDTNVSINPRPSSDPTAESLRQRRANSIGALLAARLDYAWLQSGPWVGTAGYSFFQTLNEAVPAFNVQNHLGRLGAAYTTQTGGMPLQLAGQYSFDSLSLNGHNFLDRNTLLASGTLVESDAHLTIMQGQVQIKNFSSLFLIGAGSFQPENRDAVNWMVGLTHVFRFAGDKHLLRVGYQYDIDDAKGGDWFYRGNRFLAGAQYTLPWQDIRLKYDFDIHLRRYPHPNSLFPVATPGTVVQEVTEHNHVFRIEVPLPGNLTAALDNQMTISRSNIPVLFNYDRNVTTLSIAWGF